MSQARVAEAGIRAEERMARPMLLSDERER